MSRPSRSSAPTLAQRLRHHSPSAYGVVGPPARAVRRALGMTLDAFETWRCSRQVMRAAHSADSAPVRVLLDGIAFQEEAGGIARVWHSVLAEWSQSGFSEGVVIVDRDATAPRHPGFRYVRAPRVRQPHSRAHSRLLQRLCDSVDARAFMSTGYTYPLATPSVLMVYDMTPEVLDWDLSEPKWREKLNAIEYATSFVGISLSTLDDLARFYPQSADKPAVAASLGVSGIFRPASLARTQALRTSLKLPERYFVLVGRREGYKNGSLLFQALQHADGLDGAGVLAVGGAPVLEAESARIADAVPVRLARLSDEELAVAYSGASALVYPSRYEGFGLPVVEAMACGCPVITCRNSSLSEVGGDAAIYVGEDDPPALAAALNRVLDPAEHQARALAGIAQAAQFTWERSALGIERALLAVARSSESPTTP